MRVMYVGALYGLALNFAVIMLIFACLNYGDFSDNPQELQDFFAALASSSGFYTTYIVLLGVQCLALWLVSKKSVLGLVLAFLSGGLLLPFSVLYYIGCCRTYYTAIFSNLPVYPNDQEKALIAFYPARSKTLWGLTLVTGVSCLIAASSGRIDLAFVLLLSATLGGVYLISRVEKHSPLILHDSYFEVFPHVMADRVALPYTVVREAKLLANDMLRLTIATEQGTMPVYWSINSVREEDRQEALHRFGSALSASGTLLL